MDTTMNSLLPYAVERIDWMQVIEDTIGLVSVIDRDATQPGDSVLHFVNRVNDHISLKTDFLASERIALANVVLHIALATGSDVMLITDCADAFCKLTK